ncbi:HPr family phosphocarrier protein [Endozoicomonas lisbonensis]|uniref:Phosphotransferase system HPr-like phosphotransfer protein/mannitol/fructose-specific phosphotransferase system IIA component n=1 Tax=Endozoicomonas lisbonensis TaxID=3120522 RepID=A0ABV2SB95_9GAMM
MSTEVKKPVWDQALLCHHINTVNPVTLKAISETLLRAEGYLSADHDIEREEILVGKHIVLVKITGAKHTGVGVVTTNSIVPYKEQSAVLFATIAFAGDEDEDISICDRIFEWSSDPILAERVLNADIAEAIDNVMGVAPLPRAPSEYLYHEFKVNASPGVIRHFAQNFATQMKGIDARIEFRNRTAGSKFVNGKSYLSILKLNLKTGNDVEMRAIGNQSAEAVIALQRGIYAARNSQRRHSRL